MARQEGVEEEVGGEDWERGEGEGKMLVGR